MLKLDDFETIFLLASLGGALMIASPALVFAFPSRAGERFSDLYVLGPNRMAEGYPFNVKADETYKIFLGVGNHMGSSAYYVLYVKFRNQSEPLPDSRNGTPSRSAPIFKYRVFLSDAESWEREVVFSFSEILFEDNVSRVEYLKVDGYSFLVNKTAEWNPERSGFYYQLFFELWRYDSAFGDFQYHKRFVGFWLNVTG